MDERTLKELEADEAMVAALADARADAAGAGEPLGLNHGRTIDRFIRRAIARFAALLAEVKRLGAIVGKLPKDATGKPIVPGAELHLIVTEDGGATWSVRGPAEVMEVCNFGGGVRLRWRNPEGGYRVDKVYQMTSIGDNRLYLDRAEAEAAAARRTTAPAEHKEGV